MSECGYPRFNLIHFHAVLIIRSMHYIITHTRSVQNGSGAHPAPYPTGTMGVKRPEREADHSPPSNAEVKECVELHLHSHNTPSWRGAQLKKSQGPLPYL